MTGVTHAVGGLAAGLGVGLLAPSAPVALLCGLVGLLGAGVPDLDHPQGALPRFLGPLGWVLCRAVRALSRATTGTAHRGVSHSLVAALVSGLAALVVTLALGGSLAVALALAVAAFAGVVAALVGDAVTHAGLDHVFWPLPVRLRLPKWAAVRVGKVGEWLVAMPISVFCACWAGWSVVTAAWV